jgi:hypothetical protein
MMVVPLKAGSSRQSSDKTSGLFFHLEKFLLVTYAEINKSHYAGFIIYHIIICYFTDQDAAYCQQFFLFLVRFSQGLAASNNGVTLVKAVGLHLNMQSVVIFSTLT